MECVFNRLYATICRDPDTGEGGLAPTPSDFHADAFRRIDSVRANKTTKSGNDRLLEIDYLGTVKYQGFANGTGSRRRGQFRVMMRIGYFAGDNHAHTQIIMAADDRKIGVYIQKLDNIPGSCDGACLEKVEYDNSQVIKLDDQRYELQITLRLQVH